MPSLKSAQIHDKACERKNGINSVLYTEDFTDLQSYYGTAWQIENTTEQLTSGRKSQRALNDIPYDFHTVYSFRVTSS